MLTGNVEAKRIMIFEIRVLGFRVEGHGTGLGSIVLGIRSWMDHSLWFMV